MVNRFPQWVTIDQGEGDEQERQRLEEAVNWLGETDIGKQLFTDALALHGKPVTVRICGNGRADYGRDPHRIHIGKLYVQRIKPSQFVSSSPESVLGHEMMHATQPPMTKLQIMGVENLDRAVRAMHRDLENKLEPQLIEKMQHDPAYAELRDQIDAILANWGATLRVGHVGRMDFSASGFHLIAELLKTDHSSLLRPLIDQLIQSEIDTIRKQPGVAEYVEQVERPAMMIENQLLTMRNEPLLPEDYIEAGKHKPSLYDLTEHLIRNWSKQSVEAGRWLTIAELQPAKPKSEISLEHKPKHIHLAFPLIGNSKVGGCATL